MTRALKTLDDLAPAPYNPRKIGKKAAHGLSKSLKMFEDVSGIVWNKRTGHLVTGHQRVEQLRELGAELVDGALVVGKKRWPVRVVDWPESKEKAANVAANNPLSTGGFTDDLGDILADIKLSIGDEDFTGLRFDGLGHHTGTTVGEIGEWDVEGEDVAWFMIRCPKRLVDRVKAKLAGLPKGVVVESSVE